MYKTAAPFLSIFTAFLFTCSVLIAQNDTSNVINENSNPWQISLLTCGPGEELYSSFGHSGIRVKNNQTGVDEVYNYGTFDFTQPGFYKKFTLGKLLYYVDKSSFPSFMQTYYEEKRFVKEQVLELSLKESEKIVHFLEHNLLPNNKFYKYDFIYDNCATRIRDVFPFALGNNLNYGTSLHQKKVSYRQAINQYLLGKHWERFGINLLLGARVDSAMTDASAMFLPDFLHEGFKNTSFLNKPFVKNSTTIYEGAKLETRTFNGPFWMMLGILILLILSYHIAPFSYIRSILNFLVLFISGLLGCFILFMWLGTDHQATKQNFNVLWALPTNILIAFLLKKNRGWFKIYGLAGISALLVSLIVHTMNMQELPLIEVIPFMGCLMYVYMYIYRKGLLANKAAYEDPKTQG